MSSGIETSRPRAAPSVVMAMNFSPRTTPRNMPGTAFRNGRQAPPISRMKSGLGSMWLE
ncbi:MAG: hypothetical protein IPP07_22425 [Holophagales bacterium]|nr:hypothetical protein [Holophagales bacterium]